jgi:type II secretory pathway pseudopilin PulG
LATDYTKLLAESRCGGTDFTDLLAAKRHKNSQISDECEMADPVRCTLHAERYSIRHPSSVIRLQGFTLVEIVVAIGILVMVVGFAGVIFQRSIGSYRTSMAQAEIMRKLRVITEQLDSDFRGRRKDAPMFIWFQRGVTSAADANRLDQIMFFADGDFQSTRLYDGNPIIPSNTGSPVISNLARIYYGQARSIDPRSHSMNEAINLRDYDRLFSRRQHLYIANPAPPQPQYAQFPQIDPTGHLVIVPTDNNSFEHDTNSLSQWQAAAQNSTNVDRIITSCFGDTAFNYNNNRPEINKADASTLHLLMTEGVGSISIQWSYFYTDVSGRHIFWWPNIDPDGDPLTPYSDFSSLNSFGIYFNTAAPSAAIPNWFPYSWASYLAGAVPDPVFPRALKFTFTLYDSRRVFPNGQTFSHIVYLGD